MENYQFTIENKPKQKDIAFLYQGLHEYNLTQAEDSRYQLLNIFIRDANRKIRGGLLGELFWDWLYVKIVWFHESIRNKGFGRRLLLTAEQEAL